jgi:uncharacterized protein YdeI (YjbR/CyaY-like superfamily)
VKPLFFRTPSEFRAWLAKNHAKAAELWVGFYKKDSGRPSITWPESVDQALCFGWIDGVRKSIDATSYTIRFSPRRAESIWSAINIKRVEELVAEGKVKPAGLKAYESRKENRSGIYSYEQRPAEMVEPYAGLFKKNNGAWRFFQDQPPYYRKVVTWWIVSAKREETRIKRLEKLIAHSARGERLPGLMPKEQGELKKQGERKRRAK